MTESVIPAAAGQVGLIILAGFVAGALVFRWGVPAVVGYLVGGMIAGPSLLGLLGADMVSQLERTVGDVALSLISFSIGLQFRLNRVARMLKSIFVMTAFQAVFALLAVGLGVYLASGSLVLALILGAVATASAPAELLMVIRELRASGELTRTALLVSSLNDAVSLTLYSGLLPAAMVLVGQRGVRPSDVLLLPMLEMATSVAAGALAGALLSGALRLCANHGQVLQISLATVITLTGLAHHMQFSPLLINMAAGVTMANVHSTSLILLGDLNETANPVYVLLFAVAGASLRVVALPAAGLLGSIYLGARVWGKMVGAHLGAVTAGASPTVRRYLGVTVLPQAGVALGFAVVASDRLPQISELVMNVALASTLVFSVAGTILTQDALRRSGETGRLRSDSLTREEERS